MICRTFQVSNLGLRVKMRILGLLIWRWTVQIAIFIISEVYILMEKYVSEVLSWDNLWMNLSIILYFWIFLQNKLAAGDNEYFDKHFDWRNEWNTSFSEWHSHCELHGVYRTFWTTNSLKSSFRANSAKEP